MSIRLAGITSALALLAMPQAASASPGWVAPIDFPMPSAAFSGTDEVRYQRGGVATEAFLQIESLTPLRTTAHFGTAAPGGSYTDELAIASTESSIPIEPQVAVAPDGAAVVTWIELNSSDPETALYSYHAAYRAAASNTFEAPVTITTDNERPANLDEKMTPAISEDGTAAVGIQRFAGVSKGAHKQPDYLLEVATHSAGGSWQAPVRLSPARESDKELSLAFDGDGDLTAAYTQRFFEGADEGENRDTVITDRRPASSGLWGPEENLTGSEPQWSADSVQLGENENGGAVIAYQYVGGSPKSLDAWAATREGGSGGTWSSPRKLVTKAASSVPLAVAVMPGAFPVAYVLYNLQGESSAESCVGVAWANSSFVKSMCLSPLDEEAHAGSIVFIGAAAYLGWSASPPGEPMNETVQSARWTSPSVPAEAAVDLDQPGQAYGSPTLIADGLGDVVALYSAPGGVLRAAAYDESGPILFNADVPSTATAGEPLSFSASYVNLWSGLGANQPTWNFGDGDSAAGAQVTHAFATPGVYPITLESANLLGVTTSTTYSITVTPAIVKPPPPLLVPRVTLVAPICSKRLSARACTRYKASRAAWQTLTGQVTDLSSAIAKVQVAVYFTSGSRVEGLLDGRFRDTTRAIAQMTFVTAKVTGTRWSLRLPKLKAGNYTILVHAADTDDHVSATLDRTVRLH